MFEMPKTIIRKVLNLYHTAPAQLTPAEQNIAQRIEVCALCDNIWVRRIKRQPSRCPKCHRRGWNRPLFEALMATSGGHPADEPQPKGE